MTRALNPSAVPIDPTSRSRLPAVSRDTLDADGQRYYDRVAGPGSQLIAGLQGPCGLWLHMPAVGELMLDTHQQLKTRSALDERQREIVILATARAMRSTFEWTMHEPVAVRCGVAPELIERIRHDHATDGLDAADAALIDLCREVYRDGRVSDTTYTRARQVLGQDGVVSAAALSAHYALTAVMLGVFDQQPALPTGSPTPGG